ncbi:histidine phosphatase family protein [Pseudanabaena sp. FACHB-2040]|uniref:histidine phosphatase family protein n=1 Tax=Pseudanabaena sp. FACHB-2040 TaxID=2692859 RepID=UPI00321FD801
MAPPFLQILLIRHAESEGNPEGRMVGWQPTPLTAVGRQQAAALGQRLLDLSWQPTHIYCSPLLRSKETLRGMVAKFGWALPDAAALLSSDEDTPLQPLPIPLVWAEELKEYQNGVFQGLTWAEAQQNYPDLCQQLEASRDWLPIPGAETLEQGRARAVQFVEHLLNQHQNGDRIWIISHHWLLQQVLSGLLGCDRTWGFAISYTALFELWLDRQRWQADDHNLWNSELWQVKRFNDCQHLHRSL